MNSIDQKKNGLESLLSGLNANTILLIFGFAMLYWMGGVFLTKEVYYRDQQRLEAVINKMDASLTKLESSINSIQLNQVRLIEELKSRDKKL